jgi:ribosomal protein S12 methylthiotransferase
MYEKVCSYIDVPLQHASPAVLKRMKRGAGAEIFLKSIEKMRRTVPNLTLRTSFIVGFPGETEEDFEELCRFVTAAQFDWLGVFAYSDEEGSAAWHLESKVPQREIERRRKRLMQIQRRISKRNKAKLVGEQFEVLALGPAEETELLWEGRTQMHAPEIDGKLFINDFGSREELAPGEFYRCEITESHDYDLVAKIVS